MIGIYKITNPNGHVYIGQSANIENRFNDYKSISKYSNSKISKSIAKYGIESHSFEIIEICEKHQLSLLEKQYIIKFNSIKKGLNVKNGTSKMHSNVSRVVFSEDSKVTVYETYSLKLQIKDTPHYKVSPCGKVFNCKRNKEVKRTIVGGSVGFCIAGKFYSLKVLRLKLELIPEKEYCPF